MTVPDGTLGYHWLVDYRGCDEQTLADMERIEAIVVEAIEATGATPLERAFHRFNPTGVSGAVLLEESHITIHTWPSKGYAAVDFYTCGQTRPRAAHGVLHRALGAADSTATVIQRGIHPEAGTEPSQVLVAGPELGRD